MAGFVEHVRQHIDTLARYGGEEFVLILPESNLELARLAAERIRKEISSEPFGGEDEEPVAVSVSIGYAAYPEHGMTPQVLLHAADQAMYAAKRRGRDRVAGAEELAGDSAPEQAALGERRRRRGEEPRDPGRRRRHLARRPSSAPAEEEGEDLERGHLSSEAQALACVRLRA